MTKDNRTKSEEDYDELSERDHLLLKPQLMLGSAEIEERQGERIVKDGKMVYENIILSDLIERLYFEVLVNCTDNARRSRDAEIEPGRTEVTIKGATISVYNEGQMPSLEKREDGQYVPDMVFGKFRTGSNFKKNASVAVGGAYGFGAKAVNVFSKEFKVEVANGKKRYSKTYRENLSIKEDAIHSVEKEDKFYLRITYTIDTKRVFGDEKEIYNEGTIALFKRHVYDASFSNNLVIHFNGEKVDMTKTSVYASTFYDLKKTKHIIHEQSDCKIIYLDTPDDGGFIGFCDGVNNTQGGAHVEKAFDVITKQVKELCKEKSMNKSDIKKNITLIISIDVKDPIFIGQIKEKFKSPMIKLRFKDEQFAKLPTWESVKRIQNIAIAETKFQGKKTKRTDVAKLIDAEYAAHPTESMKCTLILVEGDSAMATAKSILSLFTEDERQYYGVLPVQGVFLNILNASPEQLEKNAEMLKVTTATGINSEVDYSIEKNLSTLRYRYVLLMADADHDGTHIRSLLMLFFSRFKGLVEGGFISSLLTPILVHGKGKNLKYFYSQQSYEKFRLENKIVSKVQPEYIKGLARLEHEHKKHICDTFNKVVSTWDEKSESKLSMAFHKDRTLDRKKWLAKYDPKIEPFIPTEENNEQPISEFIDKELITFSQYSNYRSIPTLIDGLKPSQRKLLFIMLKTKTLKNKVADVAAETSKETNYHHGSKSLEDALTRMCQTFPGTNNIPLFIGYGEVGTSAEGGHDMGSGRYVHAGINPIAKLIFRNEDEVIYEYEEYEGKTAEPKTFKGIIPMCLVNGKDGLGTGYSTSTPCHNPLVIIEWLQTIIASRKGLKPDLSKLPEIIPWFRHYFGKISTNKGKVYSESIIKKVNNSNHEIHALPIYTYSGPYSREVLTKLEKEGSIKSFKNKCTEIKGISKDLFVIEGCLEINVKKFSLKSVISLKNMTLFDENMNLKKYTSAKDIVLEFFTIRQKDYKRRKDAIIKIEETQVKEMNEKVKFIDAVLSKKLVIDGRNNEDIKKDIEILGLNEKYTILPIGSFSIQNSDKIKAQAKNITIALEDYKNKDILDIWNDELEELKVALKKYL